MILGLISSSSYAQIRPDGLYLMSLIRQAVVGSKVQHFMKALR